ncbi:MAG: ATP-binding protein [Nanoarchaeales archaeon]
MNEIELNKQIINEVFRKYVFTKDKFNLILVRGRSGYGKTYTISYLAYKYLADKNETIQQFLEKCYVCDTIYLRNFLSKENFKKANCLILDEIDRVFEDLHKDIYRFLNRIRKFFNKPIFVITHNIGDLLQYNRNFKHIARYLINFFAPRTFKIYEIKEKIGYHSGVGTNYIGTIFKSIEYKKDRRYVIEAMKIAIPNEILKSIQEVIDYKENMAKEYYIKKLRESLDSIVKKDKEEN